MVKSKVSPTAINRSRAEDREDLTLYALHKQKGKDYFELLKGKTSENLTKIVGMYSKDAKYSNPLMEDLSLLELSSYWYYFLSKLEDYSIKYEFINSNERQAKINWIITYKALGKKAKNIEISSVFFFKDGEIILQEDDFDLHELYKQQYGRMGSFLYIFPIHRKFMSNRIRKELDKIINPVEDKDQDDKSFFTL